MAVREQGHQRIRTLCRQAPLVDAHAHNVVALDSNIPFIQCFSESRGEALAGVPHNLSYQRGLQELSSFYGTEPSLASIEAYRNSVGLDSFSAKCFEAANISTVLLDDGLNMDNTMGLGWHRKYIPGVHRVVRIESVAEAVLNQKRVHGPTWTLESFDHSFVSILESLSQKVVAFKSIAAYRSGLCINPSVSKQKAEDGLHENIQSGIPVRLSNKALIDFIFVRALEVATEQDLPMQIHTGFGDKDLQLELANPLHLRAVLEHPTFTRCRVVLLHGSYPFMREASYLASVYPQVHLDFGLVVPKLSVRGMRCAISDLLDLAPVNKIMFSTDGFAFPETFYLGAKWSRDMLARVLCEAYDNGDLLLDEALDAADGILRKNAMAFYKLEGISNFSASPSPSTESFTKFQGGFKGLNPNSTDLENTHTAQPELPACVQEPEERNGRIDKDPKCQEAPKEKGTLENGNGQEEMAITGSKEQAGKVTLSTEVKHVRLLWGDGSGQLRCRVVPVGRFGELVVENGVRLPEVSMGMTSHSDFPAVNSGLSVVGEICLMPDLCTKSRLPWLPEHEIVLADMHMRPGVPWQYCPRSTLRRLCETLENEFGLVLRAGFDSEFYLLKQSTGPKKWEGVDATPYSSSAGFDAASHILSDIFDNLLSLEIHVDQMHSESGGGQFKMALAPTPGLSAADNVLFLREAVTAVANKSLLHATFLPKFSETNAGSGSHIHLSLWQGDTNLFMAREGSSGKQGISQVGKEFMAGIFLHLPALLAFTASSPNSYENIQPTTWTDLVINCEFRSFDGCANPHLVLASILAAGIDGLRQHLQLPEPNETLETGKNKRLPVALELAVKALEANKILHELLGIPLVTALSAIRTAEVKFYKGRQDAEELLMERY